jgi:hypothetical protein
VVSRGYSQCGPSGTRGESEAGKEIAQGAQANVSAFFWVGAWKRSDGTFGALELLTHSEAVQIVLYQMLYNVEKSKGHISCG